MTLLLKLTLSLIAGLILPLAFAPFSIWPLAYLSVILFIYVLNKQSPKNTNFFLIGFFYGVGSLGFGVSWIFNSIYNFSGIILPIAILCTVLFILFFALLNGLWAYIFKSFFQPTPCNTLLAFPALGVLSEWCRSNLFSGFPWLLYGYSQIDSPLHSLATIVGVYGLSFSVLVVSAALYLYFNKVKLSNTITLGLVALAAFVASKINFIQQSTTKHSVAICQSNLNPQQQAEDYGNINDTWQLYYRQVEKNLDKDLIIWPESSIPVPLPYSQKFIEYLDAFGKKHHLSIIVGILKQDKQNPQDYFNSLIVTGLGQATYYKHHLVPFGEYIPYKKLLTPVLKFIGAPLSSVVPSKSKQLVTIPGLDIIPAICYEITFTDFIRQAINEYNAHVIVNISEDGWFGDSLGPHQHLEIARMRALENGAYVIRSTPTGLSAIIDYHGKVITQAPQFTRTFITGEIYGLTGKTLWSRMGQWPILLLMLGILLVLIVV